MPPATRPFVGRGTELRELAAGLDAAAAGRGSLYLVAGEPGIGKTRLCDELESRALERGFCVAWGRSWEAFGAPAYWPWIQVLRALSRHAPRIGLTEDEQSALRELLPELDDAPPLSSTASTASTSASAAPASNAAEERFRLFDAVTTRLREASSRAPLLVVLEDLHAADPSSLALLAFFARELRGAAICAVGTFRDQEAGESAWASNALAQLTREASVIHPRRFARGEVKALIEQRSGASPADELVDAILKTTEGHPLFVDEVYRALAGADDAPLRLPDTVRRAITDRLARLPPDTRELAGAASVLGREFRVETLAAMLGVERPRLDSALEQARRAAVVNHAGDGTYVFTHALVRDALYRELSGGRRAALHESAAAAIEHVEAGERALSEIAMHLLEAAPAVGEDRALLAARLAAARALAKYAFEDAALLLGRAIDALEPRVKDLCGLGEAFVLLGEALVREGKDGTAACLRAAEIGRRNGDPSLVARAGLSLGAEITPAVIDQTLVALLKEALDLLPSGPGPLRARVLARLAGALQPAADPAVPVKLAREAITMARELGDDETLRYVYLGAGSALVEYAPPHERLELNEDTLRLAQAANDAPLAFRARLRLFFDHIELGNALQAETNLVENERLAGIIRHPRYRFYARMQRATRAVLEGRFAEAEECERDAAELVQRLGDASLLAGLAQHRFGKSALRHEDDRFPEMAEGFFELLRPLDSTWFGLVQAFIDARAGRLDAASAFVRAVPESSPMNRHEMSAMHLLAEMRLRTGVGEASDTLLSSLESRRGTFTSWGIFGMIAFAPVSWLIACVQAARGDRQAALRDFEDAASQAEAVGARAALAQVVHDHAFALVVRFGDPAAAAPLIQRCRVLASELELPRLAVRANQLGAGGEPGASITAAAADALPALRFSLVKEGETWTVKRGRHEFRLKDSRGLRMLSELVAAAGREVHVLALGAGGDPGDLGDAGEVLDPGAVRAYRDRIEALRDREREAEAAGDSARLHTARQEIEFLAQQLAEGLGLGGRGRRAAAAAERARTNVQRRLRDAIRRIEEHDAELGRYLGWTVRTGIFCSFAPA